MKKLIISTDWTMVIIVALLYGLMAYAGYTTEHTAANSLVRIAGGGLKIQCLILGLIAETAVFFGHLEYR